MINLMKYSLTDQKGSVQPVNFDSNFSGMDELSNLLPAGIYTTFRTYQHDSILNFEGHIQRLEHSAQLKSRNIKINPIQFRHNLRTVIDSQVSSSDYRIRVIITWTDKASDETAFIAVEELTTPAKELYQSGVSVKTVNMHRDNPEAKSTQFIRDTSALRSKINNGLNEMLMVSENGVILEGFSSNFFAIKDNSIFTMSDDVLPGITRGLVLQIAEYLRIPVFLKGIKLSEINSLHEAFITSTSRGVLPVVKIDDVMIGSGKPGKLTRRIMDQYNHSIEKMIEPI